MRMLVDDEITFSVVVPIYNSSSSITALLDRLERLDAAWDHAVEGVFVVDGSPDDSLEILRRELPGRRFRSQILTHSRNFGAFAAVRTGLAAVRGQWVAVMAADLQEPEDVIHDFFRLLSSGDWDVVVGERSSRDDPATSAAAASLYWRLYRRFINREIPAGGVDVFGCTRSFATQLVSFPESHTSLVGLIYWMGYRRAVVPYARQARHSGTSAWTLGRKIRYFLDSVFAFTDLPIIALQVVGTLGAVTSILVALVVFFGWLLGAVRQPGYTPIMIAIAGSTSLLLLALGVVGSYVWRTYENSKQRPHELVASREMFAGAAQEEAPRLERVSHG